MKTLLFPCRPNEGPFLSGVYWRIRSLYRIKITLKHVLASVLTIIWVFSSRGDLIFIPRASLL